LSATTSINFKNKGLLIFYVFLKKEFDYRRDFRKEVVVTIDPLTARDLDDALHIKRIKGENGEEDCWEVGVHIADVAYFLPIDTEVNSWARSRGTTVYLVHKVFFNYSFVDIKRYKG